MPVSGKESILNGIFRICCVPQESQSPLVKHGQASGHNAVQFLGTLAKDAAANCWLSFNQRCYRRHKRILSEQPRVSRTTHYSLSIHSRIYAGQFSNFKPSASQPFRNLTALRSASFRFSQIQDFDRFVDELPQWHG